MSIYQLECPICHNQNDITVSVCSSCGSISKYTANVRRALIPSEVAKLDANYKVAKEILRDKMLKREGALFESEVQVKGKAVINLDFKYLWEWLMHGSTDYMSYRRLVLQNIRPRATFLNDNVRSSVETALFGSEVDIIYAALTVNDLGLSSYGPISVVLHAKQIEKRTSLLEKNSFLFIEDAIGLGWNLFKPLPTGHFAPWTKRSKLAINKVYQQITQNISEGEMAQLVLKSTGDRSLDDFFELYIYGQINKGVVELIKFPVYLLEKMSEEELIQYEELKNNYKVEEY